MSAPCFYTLQFLDLQPVDYQLGLAGFDQMGLCGRSRSSSGSSSRSCSNGSRSRSKRVVLIISIVHTHIWLTAGDVMEW